MIEEEERMMVKRGRVLVLAVVVALGLCAVAVNAAEKKKAGGGKEVVWPADKLQFKEAIPGVSKAVLWGNPDKGAYGAITRFSKGTKNTLHTHSHDIKIIVISGSFVYDSGSGEKRLGAGSYLMQPGGLKHTSGAGSDADCVFFEESSGAFDLKPVK
jgi:quercetin dioxygenase-like cupin family protein